MRINGIKHITFPNGSPGIHIAAGPGMLRRIRRLVAEHSVTVEAVSKRGKVCAAGSPRPDVFNTSYITSGGVGRQWPRTGFIYRKNSGAPRRNSLKCRRPRTPPPLVKSSRLPARPRLMIMSAGDVRGEGISAVAAYIKPRSVPPRERAPHGGVSRDPRPGRPPVVGPRPPADLRGSPGR